MRKQTSNDPKLNFQFLPENTKILSTIYSRKSSTTTHRSPKIEKMHYLKRYIRDEPSRMIQHLQITESKLLDRILNQPRIQEESVEKLKKLHDTTKECLEALNDLDIQIET